jgi:hypothetical protein
MVRLTTTAKLKIRTVSVPYFKPKFANERLPHIWHYPSAIARFVLTNIYLLRMVETSGLWAAETRAATATTGNRGPPLLGLISSTLVGPRAMTRLIKDFSPSVELIERTKPIVSRIAASNLAEGNPGGKTASLEFDIVLAEDLGVSTSGLSNLTESGSEK